MKCRITLTLGILAMVALATPALAVHFSEDTAVVVDCTGWTATGSVWFGSVDQVLPVDVEVALTDANGQTEKIISVVDVSTDAAYRWQPFEMSGTFDNLCGEYTVSVVLHVLATNSERSTDPTIVNLVCECSDPPEGTCKTPGFWKNHVEIWPVNELTLGGVLFSQEELLALLNTPVRGDMTIILGYHLIAAKLNVAYGYDPGIQDRIDEADAVLADNPVYSRPGGQTRHAAEDVKDSLANYNENFCDTSKVARAAAKEIQTWSTLKALYKN